MKRSFEEEIDEEIALACYKQFNLLSSRGKPSSNEWTHLAAFVIRNENNQIEILSIGTGTKCLGGEKDERGIQGCLLHDSHAEVIARRGLIRFFYEEILKENNSILIKEEKNKFYWNKSFRLYLFVSYSPCGAAAYLSDPIKRPKLEHKSINSTELYLKPGKGYQTTSLSCTNKINRWIYQGIEGCLLNQIITTPIRLSALIIQTNSDLSSIFKNIQVISVKKSFEYGPSLERTRPCSMSIAWWKGLDLSSSVVTVDGHPLGQVKKLRQKQQYANPLAKCSLFKLYLQLMDHLSPETTTYAQAKALSSNSLRNQFMENNPQWIQTDPDIFYSFTLSS
jgi:tRNA-specific adenosine deaminase 1